MDDLLKLDEETQRRLVLQAAKVCGEDTFKDLQKRQPTVAKLDSDIHTDFWLSAMLCWTFWAPIFCLWEAHSLWKVRRLLRKDWKDLLAQTDRECAHLVLAGDIRRILDRLPRSQRRQKREIAREIERVSRHWSDLNVRIGRLDGTLRALPSVEVLENQQDALAARIAQETDPMVLASLHNQIQALEGQRQARRDLEVWRVRLEASQQECTQSLLHLRSRLTLLLAAGEASENVAIAEATATLQQINTNLTSAQEAAEEVLRMGA